MSAIQPAELWQESKRWFAYGPEMWRVKTDPKENFCLGPTHEVSFHRYRHEMKYLRIGNLPVNLYQIQTKYRDEARPRFGFDEIREFIMKDAYSLIKMKKDWMKVTRRCGRLTKGFFTRCGLTFRAVEADTGAIGGSTAMSSPLFPKLRK